MNSHFTYLLVDLSVIFFPLLLSFTKRFYFIHLTKKFFISNVLVTLFFIIWDVYFTYQNVWSFNNKYVFGLYFFNLPIEEVIFFIAIPYACTFSYFVISKFYDFSKVYKLTKYFYYSILIICFIVSLFYWRHKYTYTSFILNNFFILFLILRKEWILLQKFLFAYMFVLIFFILSNGVLTGSFFIAEPVVKYNPNEIIGVRIFNIPVEDFFYGMLLQYANYWTFEKLNINTKPKCQSFFTL